jgi:hypothetical protein
MYICIVYMYIIYTVYIYSICIYILYIHIHYVYIYTVYIYILCQSLIASFTTLRLGHLGIPKKLTAGPLGCPGHLADVSGATWHQLGPRYNQQNYGGYSPSYTLW